MAPTPLDLLRDYATRTPEAPCLSYADTTLNFAAVDARSSRVANALIGHGIRPGDRVAIIARNVLEHYELFFGCAKAGAILLPLNWRLSAGEIAAILADAEPALIVVAGEFAKLIGDEAATLIDLEQDYAAWRDVASPDDPRREGDAGETALILYTSGTTGVPKGAMISQTNLGYVERMARELWGFTAASVNLIALPLFHIGGIGYGMMALTQGGHSVIVQQPTPDIVIAAIRAHGVTHAFFVPAVIQTLVDAPGVDAMDLTSLDRLLYGAAPISEALLRRAIAVFGCAFNHAYGMTETAGTVITLAPQDHDPGGLRAHGLRSCGQPVPWAELELVDPATGAAVATGEVGEIRVRSGMVMRGYWRKAAETAATMTADGWLCTGDAAYRDADGYIYIHDRYKDMIVSGAENIYPTELENILAKHSGVAQVAVIGVAHERWGETPKAFVVAREGAAPSEAELIEFTRARIARYKCPTAVAFVAELPRNASGKVLKKEMRDPAWLAANG